MSARGHISKASDLMVKRARHRRKAGDHRKRLQNLFKGSGVRHISVG